MKLGLGLGLPASTLSKGVGVSYTPEALALFARFTTPPTTARKTLINNLIVSLLASGVWAKLDALYLMAAADSQAARRNWVADLFNLTAASGPTFTADRGYQGDGASSYLQTGYNLSSGGGKFAQNSAMLGVWVRTENNAIYTDIGAGTVGGGGSYVVLRSRDGGNLVSFTNVSGVGVSSVAVATSVGFSAYSRTGASTVSLYKNGSHALADTKASVGLPSANLTVLAREGAVQFSANQVSAALFGSGLTDTEELATYNALNTYLTAIGA